MAWSVKDVKSDQRDQCNQRNRRHVHMGYGLGGFIGGRHQTPIQ